MSILSTLAGALGGAPNANPGATTTLNPATAAAGGLVVSQIIAMLQNSVRAADTLIPESLPTD